MPRLALQEVGHGLVKAAGGGAGRCGRATARLQVRRLVLILLGVEIEHRPMLSSVRSRAVLLVLD